MKKVFLFSTLLATMQLTHPAHFKNLPPKEQLTANLFGLGAAFIVCAIGTIKAAQGIYALALKNPPHEKTYSSYTKKELLTFSKKKLHMLINNEIENREHYFQSYAPLLESSLLLTVGYLVTMWGFNTFISDDTLLSVQMERPLIPTH